MTSVMRYRAEEEGSGDIVPPKPHRLKPLGDEELQRSADGATNSEDANATPPVPRPPDRPFSADQLASPKTRNVKASSSGAAAASGLAETVDSMSGASTADTAVIPADEASPSASSLDKATSKNKSVRTGLPPMSWTENVGPGSSKLQSRRSMVMPTSVIVGGDAREMLNFLYRKAEQRCMWNQMQHRTSDLLVGEESLGKLLGDGERGSVATEAPEERADCLDVLGLLEGDAADASSSTKVEEAAPAGTCRPRRQSVYILKAELEVEAPRPKKKKKTAPEIAAPESAPESAPAPAASVSGVSPLKELLSAKKVDYEGVRALFKTLADGYLWIEAPLDPGPPVVPKPLVFALGMNDPAMVGLVIELGANVMSTYDGACMYKGWLKPETDYIKCVQNRKGRFVGTMLADRLTDCELKLTDAVAEARKKGEEGDGDDSLDTKPTEEILLLDETVEEVRGHRRKSVSVKSVESKQVMRHTQGHPGDVFEISEHLADGDRSSVWLGFHKDTKAQVAIKTEHKSASIEMWLWEEINIMRKVDHPNVAQLFETFENHKHIFMVVELCEGGRLFDKCTPEDCAHLIKSPRLMKQTASAIDFLHSKGVAHRDVQLDNFLLADEKPLSEGTVKLIDFTTAKNFGKDEPPLKTKICTPGYVAKEILTRKEIPYTEKVDIWSLGVLFFVMLSGSPPFQGTDDMDTLKKVKKGVFKFEPEDRWAPVPETAKQLISLMIKPEVEERLSSRQVLDHAFLANV